MAAIAPECHKTRMARRVLLKRPGEKPEPISVKLQDESIRKLIGCTFETREYLGVGERANATIICAHQDTARALKFTEHIWLPTGYIAGPVIVTQTKNGQYVDLTDDEISIWTSRLLEFEERKDEYAHQIVTKLEEKQQRRSYYLNKAIIADDDFAAILRMQAEIEQQLRDLVASQLPVGAHLRRARFDVSQLLAIGAALKVIPERYLKIINALAEVRNKLVHEPGYFPAPEDVTRLRRLAPQCRPFTDTHFIETFIFSDRADEGFSFSQESIDLRLLYYVVILVLDPEGGWLAEVDPGYD
jgi:hypothetical protein